MLPAFNNALFAIVGNQQPGRIDRQQLLEPMDGMDAPAIAAGTFSPREASTLPVRSPEYAG
ncbi:hypothetical protein ECZU24_11840 [Escherichia coli]|nr:hypothetical protein ECZU24_11840 [Escherichia coli]